MKSRKHRTVGKEKALAARLQSGRDEWDEAPVEAEVQSQRAVVTSLRLPVGEFTSVQKASKAAGQTVSDFIRNAISARLHGGTRITSIQIGTGSSEGQSQVTVFASTTRESGRTHNPGPAVPMVPQYSNLTG